MPPCPSCPPSPRGSAASLLGCLGTGGPALSRSRGGARALLRCHRGVVAPGEPHPDTPGPCRPLLCTRPRVGTAPPGSGAARGQPGPCPRGPARGQQVPTEEAEAGAGGRDSPRGARPGCGSGGCPPPPADLQPLRLQEGRTPLTQPSGHSPALRDTPVPWAGCLGTVLRSARHGATLFPGAWPLCSASTAASHQEVRAALAEHRAGC